MGIPHCYAGIAGTLRLWQRIIADYNQDGMVSGSDLTPIGQNYCFDMSLPQVGYDDPADHGGFEQWTGGDPDDGEAGSLNWRLAWVDGNGDGYILQYDITPIAIHWDERLTGYRLHQRGPWRNREHVELATLAWVDWFNSRRLMGPKGFMPPQEYEAQWYSQRGLQPAMAGAT